jgi:hypothetical protein
MKLAVVAIVVLAALSCVHVGAIKTLAERVRKTARTSKWDVMTDNAAANAAARLKGKGPGHELLVPSPLPSSLDAVAVNDGVRFNDLPSVNEKVLGAVAFLKDFLAGEKPDTANHNDAVFNTHFGCLQHWHSMAPSVEPESKGKKPRDQIVFSNAEVKYLIIRQAQDWWRQAVAAKNNKKMASKNIGRLLHMMMDSWPQGHVLRGTESIKPTLPSDITAGAPIIPNTCGKVYYFQGYPAQAGCAKHGDVDHEPKSGGRNKDLWDCAKYYSFVIARSFHLCATGNKYCAFPTAIFDAIYNLGYPAVLAGGATDTFQGPKASEDFVKSTSAIPGQAVWIPKSTKRRQSASAQYLCGNITARKVGTLTDSESTNSFASEFLNANLKSSW